MTTIISKVRAEIERIMCEYEPFEGGIDETTGAHIALAKLLSFLDTLEEPVCHYGDVPSYERCVVCSANCSARVEEKSEKPINLEDAVKEYFHGMWPGMDTPEQCNTDLHFTPPAIMRLVKHFYELDRGRSEKPNNHFYGIGAIRNGVQEKIDWFRSRPYFDEKSDYSKGFLDALVDMRSLVNRPDFDNPEGLDEAAEQLYHDIWFPSPADGLVQSRLKERNAFKAGAERQKEQCKLKVSDDIDGEIESYIPHLDIPYAELTDEIYHLCVLIARHFAEWQKAQDDKYVDTIYQQGIEKGKDEIRSQGEVVEGTLGYGPHLQRPIIHLEGVPSFYDGHCQEVIVQIRKK